MDVERGRDEIVLFTDFTRDYCVQGYSKLVWGRVRNRLFLPFNVEIKSFPMFSGRSRLEHVCFYRKFSTTTAKVWPVLSERFSPRTNRNWMLATNALLISNEFRVCLDTLGQIHRYFRLTLIRRGTESLKRFRRKKPKMQACRLFDSPALTPTRERIDGT